MFRPNVDFGQASSNINQYETTTTRVISSWNLGYTLQLIHSGNPSQGQSTPGAQEASPLAGKPAGHTCSLLGQAKPTSAVPCGWNSAVSAKHLSMLWSIQRAASPASLDLLSGTSSAHFVHQRGGFHLDEYAGHAAWSSQKDVSPTICLSDFQREQTWP